MYHGVHMCNLFHIMFILDLVVHNISNHVHKTVCHNLINTFLKILNWLTKKASINNINVAELLLREQILEANVTPH